MFCDDTSSKALQSIIHELNTTFTKETIRICNKKLDLIKITETENIKIGQILSKTLDLNGLPKKEFMKRLNRVAPKTSDHKHDRTVTHNLTTAYEDLLKIDKFTDASEAIRMVLHQTDSKHKELRVWMEEYSGAVIDCIVTLKFLPFFVVQMENSCYTLAIMVHKFNFIFEKYYKKIIVFLLMIVTECCSTVQEYIDQRNDKLEESHSMSFDQDTEVLFHFPLFKFKSNNCNNRLLSVAYFTLAFLFDCVTTPSAIIFLMMFAVNTKEVGRLYIVSMFHHVILSIDPKKCKTDPEWTELPLRIHNEIIKFYVDKNAKIRELVTEINVFNKQCSVKKLPFITKPVLDTVDMMIDVIKKKVGDLSDLTGNREAAEVSTWRKVLDLEKTASKLSTSSDSSKSTTSKSKFSPISFSEDEKEDRMSRSDLYVPEFFSNDLRSRHTRQTVILPNLTDIMGLTKLRTKKLAKRTKMASTNL